MRDPLERLLSAYLDKCAFAHEIKAGTHEPVLAPSTCGPPALRPSGPPPPSPPTTVTSTVTSATVPSTTHLHHSPPPLTSTHSPPPLTSTTSLMHRCPRDRSRPALTSLSEALPPAEPSLSERGPPPPAAPSSEALQVLATHCPGFYHLADRGARRTGKLLNVTLLRSGAVPVPPWGLDRVWTQWRAGLHAPSCPVDLC